MTLQWKAMKAVMKLHKEHPEIIPKIPKIFEVMKKGLPIALSDLEAIGVTKEEVTVLEDLGILNKGQVK